MSGEPARDCIVPLFVPGDRPERFLKAAQSGADAVILDLEDAVGPDSKELARKNVRKAGPLPVPAFLRVNAVGTPWHAEDIALAAMLDVAGVMLPKTQSAAEAEAVNRATGKPLIVLIESAPGMAQVRAIAAAKGVVRLNLGSLDYAADLGAAHTREALLPARAELVLASRLARLNGPLDGVTTAIHDDALSQDDAAYGASLGFTGKCCIHPRQVASVKRGYRPSEDEIAWANKIMAAAQGGAVKVEGTMVDAPVRIRAEQILRRANV